MGAQIGPRGEGRAVVRSRGGELGRFQGLCRSRAGEPSLAWPLARKNADATSGGSLTGRRRRWDPGSRDPLLSLGMKMIVLLLVFISCLTVPTLSSFWQFQRMVKHITGRSAFLSYYGYGCYCGLGGKGVPVDDTDRCCLTHDCCYKKLKESGCQPVLNSYQFHVINKTVVCGCSLGPGGSCLCGLKACECDRQSAFCFRRSLPTYERNFKLLSGRPPCGRQKLQC